MRGTSRAERVYDYVEGRDDAERPRRRPAPSSPSVVDTVSPRHVPKWLSRGASDIVACRGRSLVYGVCYTAMGYAIVRAHEHDRLWLEGLVAGFLFLGPFLAVGTYELSRQRERGEPAELLVSLFAWCRNPRGLCLHALLLCGVLTLWLHSSWALMDRMDPTAGAAAAGFVTNLLRWAAWFGCALVAFVTGVVAVPLLLDRSLGALTAVRTSVACCLANPLAMVVWAVTTASLIGASLWLGFWPLLLVGPWIGHATWHVYRDCVSAPSPELSGPDAARRCAGI